MAMDLIRSGAPILLVEDDRDLRAMMALWLNAEGYEVRTATNGREALTALEYGVPCAMVVDLMMPVMGGAELRRNVQQMPAMEGVPFILVTGEPDAEQIGRDLDATAVVPKPFDAVLLAKIIATHCQRH